MTDIHRDSYQTGFHDIDESFKMGKEGDKDKETHNLFLRYSGGNYQQHGIETVKSGRESNKRVTTEYSQISNEQAFRKVKYNQIQTLKELRQEYEILRNLPVQEDFIQHKNNAKKHSQSVYSSEREIDSHSISSSDKHSRRHKKKEGGHHSRDSQILIMEKKQLEMVIANSMKKIEQLLSKEIEYKKAIHELQIQLDSRTSDDKIDALTRTIKKNESDSAQKTNSLQREIDRLNLTICQLNDKLASLEMENRETLKELQASEREVTKVEKSMRIEKEKYSTLQLDLKRCQMERELNQKALRNEMERMKKYNEEGDRSYSLAEEVKNEKLRYEILNSEFERFKQSVEHERTSIKNREEPSHLNGNEKQLEVMENLINHLKEESASQNKASLDLLATLMEKMESNAQSQVLIQSKRTPERDKKMEENNLRLKEQISHLKEEISQLIGNRGDNEPLSPQVIDNTDYEKIDELQEELMKMKAAKTETEREYHLLKSSFDFTKDEYQKLISENRDLRDEINDNYQKGHISQEELRGSFRGRENEYEETIRVLQRRVDELQFSVQKAEKERQFNENLVRNECQANLRIMRSDLQRLDYERNEAKEELKKMKAFYERKLEEKNILLGQKEKETIILVEEREKILTEYKESSQHEMRKLLKKIEETAEVNERYSELSSRYAEAERELHELRHSIRRLKAMNSGVEHLWEIKEAEYQNINELMGDMRFR